MRRRTAVLSVLLALVARPASAQEESPPVIETPQAETRAREGESEGDGEGERNDSSSSTAWRSFTGRISHSCSGLS